MTQAPSGRVAARLSTADARLSLEDRRASVVSPLSPFPQNTRSMGQRREAMPPRGVRSGPSAQINEFPAFICFDKRPIPPLVPMRETHLATPPLKPPSRWCGQPNPPTGTRPRSRPGNGVGGSAGRTAGPCSTSPRARLFAVRGERTRSFLSTPPAGKSTVRRRHPASFQGPARLFVQGRRPALSVRQAHAPPAAGIAPARTPRPRAPTDSPVRRPCGHEFMRSGPGRTTNPRAVPPVPRHVTPAYPGAPAPRTTDTDRPGLASPPGPGPSLAAAIRRPDSASAIGWPGPPGARPIREPARPPQAPAALADPGPRPRGPAPLLARTRRLMGTTGLTGSHCGFRTHGNANLIARRLAFLLARRLALRARRRPGLHSPGEGDRPCYRRFPGLSLTRPVRHHLRPPVH